MSINMNEEDMDYAASSRNHEAKRAGHILYGQVSNSSISTSDSSSYAINRGQTSRMARWVPETGKMSPVRRTFCLFVTFDLILTFILWVIYTQLIGETPVWKAFTEQVEDFTIKYSLFDTVMLAAMRFTFLILAYALLRLDHWWVIAITTFITCGYLLAKCFLYDFSKGTQNPLSYVVLIISFVLSWAETWFLDFKVIPSEQKHKQKLVNSQPVYDERSSLLRRDVEAPSLSGEDNVYYSPLDTPENSDDEMESRPRRHGHRRQHSNTSRISVLSRMEQENYIREGQEVVDIIFNMMKPDDSDSKWKLVTGKDLSDGIIHTQHFKEYGRKVFRLKAYIDIPVRHLWEETIYNLNDSPQWNPTLLDCRTLETLDDNTEISYNVSAEAVGGMVSSRDFVSIRRWEARENMYFSCLCAVNYPDMPAQKNYVRGENGPGGMVMMEDEENPQRTIITWFLNTDLKGWLPQKIIEQSLSGFCLDYLKFLCVRCQDIMLKEPTS